MDKHTEHQGQLSLHDRVIVGIEHSVKENTIIFRLDKNQSLQFNGVLLFKSESYFIKGKGCISSSGLRIVFTTIREKSYLINEVNNRFRPDNTAKWGEEDEENWGIRSYKPLHFNLYCIDWDFDVVAAGCELY